MKNARLLHIVGGSSFGGAAKIILRLAQKMKAEGWEIEILAADPEFGRAAKECGIGVVTLDVIRREIRPWRDVIGLVRLVRFLRRERYLVVHTHTSKGGFIGRLAAWLAGVPIILHTVHGFAFHERAPWLARHFWSALERLASHWCDRIIAVTEFHRQWALELGICRAKHIVAIPNGIAWTAPRVSVIETRASLNARAGDLVLLTVSRLAGEKGLETLLEAAARLRRVSRRFRLVLAGDGPLRARLERQAEKLGVLDQVAFLGFRTDIPDLLAACDVAVLPSLREGLSISLLEAMAAGKAIVASAIGGNLSVASADDTVLFVPPGDPGALADAILQCGLGTALRLRLGENARLSFVRDYTEDRMLESYRQLYAELVNSRRPAALSDRAREGEVFLNAGSL